MTAQDQTLATKAYRVTILKQQGSKNCRMSNEKNETVMHILSECLNLVRAEDKKRCDNVVIMVQWELCSKYDFESAKHWYELRAYGLMESQDIKILWNFNIKLMLYRV